VPKHKKGDSNGVSFSPSERIYVDFLLGWR
jgi:hypothetical protein